MIEAKTNKNELKNLEKALERAQDEGDTKTEARVLHDIADLYFKKEDFHQAYKYYSKEASAWKDLDNKKKQGIALIYAGSSLQKEEKFSKSIRYLNNALDLGLELENYNIIGTCYGLLANGYKKNGNKIKATEYYTNYKNFESDVENQILKQEIRENEQELNVISTELESTEEELTVTSEHLEVTKKSLKETEAIAQNRLMKIEILNKEKALKDALIEKQNIEIENERLIRNMVVFGLLAVLILAVIIFIAYRNKRRDNRIINSQKERIVDSINYAYKIQSSMLPDIGQMKSKFKELFVIYLPQHIISGDFYFFKEIGDDIFFTVVDCTGHGVPGAIMSVIGNNALSEILNNGEKEVNKILDKLHEKVVATLNQDSKDSKDGMDISFCRINKKTRVLEFSGARNSLLYVEKGVDELKVVEADLRPVGGVYRRKLKEFTKSSIELKPDTTVYMMSDGYADQFKEGTSEKYRSENMRQLLMNISEKPLEEQEKILLKEFSDWKGTDVQTDDVCVVGFRL